MQNSSCKVNADIMQDSRRILREKKELGKYQELGKYYKTCSSKIFLTLVIVELLLPTISNNEKT